MSTVINHDKIILEGVSESGPQNTSVEMTSGDRVRGAENENELVLPGPDSNTTDENMEDEEEDGSEEEEEDDDQDDQDEKMGDDVEEEENQSLTVDLPTEKSPAAEAKERSRVLRQLMEAKANQKATRVPVGNQKLNKERKDAFKKVLKKRRRADKLASNLSDDLTKALSSFGGAGDDN